MSVRDIPTTGTEPCQLDPELFFAFESQTAAVAEAKAMCAGCRTREACREWALAEAPEFGIWGGLTRSERDELLRGRGETELREVA